YEFVVMEQAGGLPDIGDKMKDIIPLVNFDGEVTPLVCLIDDLICLWEVFLRNELSFDITPLYEIVGPIFKARADHARYSCPIPEGVKRDAKLRADERRRLNLKRGR